MELEFLNNPNNYTPIDVSKSKSIAVKANVLLSQLKPKLQLKQYQLRQLKSTNTHGATFFMHKGP